jgi:hypothetical protein
VRNTVDLDWKRLPNGFIQFPDIGAALGKIYACDKVYGIRWRRSAGGNGYHIEFWCREDCSRCPAAYDDGNRQDCDAGNREVFRRGVLWERKAYTKGGKTIVLRTGDWVVYP